MKKDAFYFPHFCNARNDSKIIKIRRVLGLEGYAIYFMLLEILREQNDFKYPITGVEDLAFEWHTSKEKIFAVINNFELFEIIEEKFFSSKLVLYLQPYIEKSERARVAANKRWETTKVLLENNNANAMQMQNKCNASKQNESEQNKIKENESIANEIIENDFKEEMKNILELNELENEFKIIFDLIIEKYNIKETYYLNLHSYINKFLRNEKNKKTNPENLFNIFKSYFQTTDPKYYFSLENLLDIENPKIFSKNWNLLEPKNKKPTISKTKTYELSIEEREELKNLIN